MGPDAFIDSMIWGGMNSVEPPYEVRVMGTGDLAADVRDYVVLMAGVLMKARADYRVRRGEDVEVSLSLTPQSSH